MNVQLGGGNVHREETNKGRKRVKEPTGSKWKMQGTGTAEMQMGRRKHNEKAKGGT